MVVDAHKPSHECLLCTPAHSEMQSTSSQNQVQKTPEEMILHILMLFQTGMGTVANVILFFYNFSPILLGLPLRPTQVIFTHMAVANSLILLCTGLPHTMTFVLRRQLSAMQCKLEYYIHLVARSTTLCSTCVLSTYQFLTLIPGKCGRARAPRATGYACCSCWLFSLLSNIYAPVKVTGPQNALNGTDSKSKWFCSVASFREAMVFLRITHDAVFIGLMGWTSGSMVLLLYRHHRKLQYVHTPNRDHSDTPETRAARTVLTLVVTFVNLYVLGCVCALLHMSSVGTPLWLGHVCEVLVASFPTISPFLLILKDPRTPPLTFLSCCIPQPR
uniref:vomeronasal type-1 receptor 4-like n=1 Tax=Jaculus jaculus TaxID=51337 RepID=UPI001E1B1196|nr:vomeronasal type-1 receptor 4-like [Jaculus jaculus]